MESVKVRNWRGRLGQVWLRPPTLKLLSSRRTESLLSCCLPAKVDTEEGLGESVLPQHALQGSGSTPCRQAGVGQAHDAIKLCVDKIGTRLVLTQAKFLVGDLNALDLGMEVKTQDSDYPDWSSLLQTLSPETSCSSSLKFPPHLDKSGRSHIVFQESTLRVLSLLLAHPSLLSRAYIPKGKWPQPKGS